MNQSAGLSKGTNLVMCCKIFEAQNYKSPQVSEIKIKLKSYRNRIKSNQSAAGLSQETNFITCLQDF